MSNADAAEWADILMILAPDEHQAAIWENDLKGNMRRAPRSPSPTGSTSISG